jgi:nucleolar GTP-binding protein
LFQSIKPLFQAKPLVIVLSKIDIQKYSDLKDEERAAIENLAKVSNAYLIQMSNISKEGIDDVKSKACDILLDHRLTQKAKDPKKAEAILNRLHVAQPKRRDNIARPEIVPDSVHQGVKKTGPTVLELQEEFGGAGNFAIPVEEHYMLAKEEWRYDTFPEFYNGSNVLDFYDPDITEKLNELEKEEAEILKMEGMDDDLMQDEEIEGIRNSELKLSLKEVRSKKAIKKIEHKMKSKRSRHAKQHDMSDVVEHFESKGIAIDKDALRSHSKVRRGIQSLEDAQDAKAKAILGEDSDEGSIIADDDVAGQEDKTRGRKRTRATDPKDMMDIDEGDTGLSAKKGRTMTPF